MSGVVKPTADDLAYLVALAQAGHYRAVRDQTYDLDEIAEAHRYVDTGHKRGNVVLRLTGAPTSSSTARHNQEALS